MTELEYLDLVDKKLQQVFDAAIGARDKAQVAIVETQAIKSDILRRKIELQQAMLADARSKGVD